VNPTLLRLLVVATFLTPLQFWSPSERDIGEVDFAFYPTISHCPMALCILRAEQLLVFTLPD